MSTANQTEVFLTEAELRARWKVSQMFIWRMRNRGELKTLKLGGRNIRFALAEVLKIEEAAAI